MNFNIRTNTDSQFRPPVLSDQVILLSRENAEVFTDVLRLRYRSDNALIIEHGQEGCCTHSYRPLHEVYNVIYKTAELIKSEKV